MSDLNEAQDRVIAPVPRITIQAFCDSPALASVIQGASDDRRMLKAQIKVQMGGGAAAAVGGFLGTVTGAVSGGGSAGSGSARGVSVEVGEEEAAVNLNMAVEYGVPIPRTTEEVRRNVINRVENLTGLDVTEVNITVNDVQLPEERPMLDQQQEVERQAQEQERQA